MTTTSGGGGSGSGNNDKSDDDGERWAKNLPDDMREVIWNKLGLLESVRLGAVCSSWRVAAVSNSSIKRRPQFPLVAASSADAAVASVDLGDEHQSREYRFPFKKQTEEIINIVTSGGGEGGGGGGGGVRFHSSNCMGSVDAWLIMAASWYIPQSPDICFQTYPFFFNPISGRVHSTSLPPIQFQFHGTPSLKAVASSPPPPPPPPLPTSVVHNHHKNTCVVALLDVERGTVHFCRPTQTACCLWTPLDTSNTSSGSGLLITTRWFLDIAMGEDAILYALVGRDRSAPAGVMVFELFHQGGGGAAVKTIWEVSAAPPKPIPAAETDQSPFIVVGLKGEVFVIWHRYDLFLGRPARTAGFAAFKLVGCVDQDDQYYDQWEQVFCWSSTSGEEEVEVEEQQQQAVLFLSFKGAKFAQKSDLSAPILEFISRRAGGSCICFAMMSLRDIGVFPLAAAFNQIRRPPGSSAFSLNIINVNEKVRRHPVWFMAKPQVDQLCL